MACSAVAIAGKREASGRSCSVEDDDQEHHDGHARTRREFVPVCGDEKQHAGCDHESAQSQSQPHRPTESGRVGLSGFELADTIGSRGVDNGCVEPALDSVLQVVSHGADEYNSKPLE